MTTLEDLSVPAPPPSRADWNDEGVVILKGFLPGDLMDAYVKEWQAAHGEDWPARSPGGWDYCTPYMDNPALFDLCTYDPLGEALAIVLQEPAAVHLNLTGFVSTERDWHQDTYLNPPHVGDQYAAVWMAMDDIDPDSGPFQYVPGSHRWHVLTRELIGGIVDLSHPEWPKHTEDVLSPLVEAEIQKRGAEVVTYLPNRGDVLIWHGRLYHRGSRANIPGMLRPSLIAHYSGIHHRRDMPLAKRTGSGWHFPLRGRQPI